MYTFCNHVSVMYSHYTWWNTLNLAHNTQVKPDGKLLDCESSILCINRPPESHFVLQYVNQCLWGRQQDEHDRYCWFQWNKEDSHEFNEYRHLCLARCFLLS